MRLTTFSCRSRPGNVNAYDASRIQRRRPPTRPSARRALSGLLVTLSDSVDTQWPGVADDPTLTAAMLDRLLHHAHIAPTKGES